MAKYFTMALKPTPRKRRSWLRLLLRLVIAFAIMAIGVAYMVKMPGRSYSGVLPPLTDSERHLGLRLKRHVATLADTVGERNHWHYGGMEASVVYISNTLREMGYEITEREYTIEGKTYKNIEAGLTGTSRPDEIILVGAHYDSAFGTPGANDNASGVAALLEMARLSAKKAPLRTVRFVFFANEEPPFFHTPMMGSRVYSARCRQRGENIVAMLSLETIGYYSDKADSQHYPFPFSLLYPDTGNFIGFVGNVSSRQLVRQAVGSFRSNTKFPSEGVAAPGWITGIDWSDHWSFWEEGYPALMVTDTALFRYEHYHTMEDTPDRIDYDGMARVVMGLTRVIYELAGVILP